MSTSQSLDHHLAAAGLTRRKLLRKVNLNSEAYLLRLWRNGGASQTLAGALAIHLKVPIIVFLWGWPHYERTRLQSTSSR